MNLPRANYPTNPGFYFDPDAPAQYAWRLVQGEPPLGVGDRCQLNSGSPTLLVVDIEPTFTVAWHNGCGVSEHVIERDAVRRITP